MRKGGMGDLGGFLRHRLHGIRTQRHEGRPSAEWVKAPAISRVVLCQSPFPRGTPQLRERSMCIFYYRNILRSKATEKASRQTHAKGTRFHRLLSSTTVILITTF